MCAWTTSVTQRLQWKRVICWILEMKTCKHQADVIMHICINRRFRGPSSFLSPWPLFVACLYLSLWGSRAFHGGRSLLTFWIFCSWSQSWRKCQPAKQHWSLKGFGASDRKIKSKLGHFPFKSDCAHFIYDINLWLEWVWWQEWTTQSLSSVIPFPNPSPLFLLYNVQCTLYIPGSRICVWWQQSTT